MLSKIQSLNKKYDLVLSSEIIDEILLDYKITDESLLSATQRYPINYLMAITSRKAKFDIIREIYSKKISGGFQIANEIAKTIFGGADASITNLKQKKECIKHLAYIRENSLPPRFPTIQNDLIYWLGRYINTSKQVKKYIIGEIKNRREKFSMSDIFFSLCRQEKTLIKLLKTGVIYLIDILPNIINESFVYDRHLENRYIRLTKACGRFRVVKYLYLLEDYRSRVCLPVKFNAYLLAKYELKPDRTAKLSNPYYLSLHFAIIHRRNKVILYDIPKSSEIIYSVTNRTSSSFAGKNLSRLSLYYI